MIEISPFMQMVQHDRDTIIFNQLELAQVHCVNGTEMPVIMENARLKKMQVTYSDAGRSSKAANPDAGRLSKATLILYVRPDDFGSRPSIGAFVELDNKKYRVEDVSGTLIYEIALGAVNSGR